MKAIRNSYSLLKNKRQLGPYPMEKLKHVDRPTNLITDQWQRVDMRESGFFKAAIGELGPLVQAGFHRQIAGKDAMSTAHAAVAAHISTIKLNEVSPVKAPIPEDPAILSRHLKRLGYFMGADVMGICEVPKSAVYRCDFEGNPIDIHYKYAIVIVKEKEYESGRASEGWDWIADSMSLQSYRDSALVAIIMADYIRRLGYPASAQYGPSWYQVQIPPLLLMAGIGEVSRVGIILNPYLSTNFKAGAVLTDMPLIPDKPVDFGLQDFCNNCKKCSTACPSQAISKGDKVMYNGYETWKVNVKPCVSFMLTNKHGSWCNTCVKVCPWTRPQTWNHNFVRRAVSSNSLARRIAIAADNMRGIEKGNEQGKWWFDLAMEDGKVVAPGSPKSDKV